MMPPPTATPWLDVLDVGINLDIAAQVHVGTVLEFTPTADTFQMMLYGPGTVHVPGLPTGVDLYVRLVSLDGQDVSDSPLPVQLTALT
jgi:hypothetical protein